MTTPRRHRSYGSQIAFIDLLFNTLVGFVFLFVMAFVLINPVAKKSNVEINAEFMVTIKWPDDSIDDVDLWVRDPLGNTVGFKSKDVGLMNLDRDDLGGANDKVTTADGKIIKVRNNEEHVTIRGIISGEYIVNVHLYSKKRFDEVPSDGQFFETIPVEVTVEKLNPYGIIIVKEIILTSKGEEITAIRFTVRADGTVWQSDLNDLPYPIVVSPYNENVHGAGTSNGGINSSNANEFSGMAGE